MIHLNATPQSAPPAAVLTLSATLKEMQATQQEILKLLQAEHAEKLRAGLSEFVSVEEAAALLGMRRQTIYKYLSEGRLKRYKKGKRVFVRRADVERLAGVCSPM